jgi:SAM-dependent methyltransferase
MADWNAGYVTDVPYTAAYHRETVPVWIATTATLLGAAPPDITRPFRYADLGCGNGVTALVVAATMPHAEVWAFDFNPAHVEAGRDVARRAGLTNITFEEASFDELASRERAALPMFDYIVAHGVATWISLENRRRLFEVIGQRLAPGGIVFISYNVATGWVAMPPVRRLLRLLADSSRERSDLAIESGLDVLDRMKEAGAAIFQEHPTLAPRLAGFRNQDRRYVSHELLNRNWHAVMFPAVATAMAGIKCDYLGAAAPMDSNTGLTVPVALRGMFAEAVDIRSRETFRDIASGSGFRRDLFQRGRKAMSSAEHLARTGSIALVREFRSIPETIEIDTSLGRFTADRARYLALLEILRAGPSTVGELRAHPALAGWSEAMLMEVVTLMLSAGFLSPMSPEPPVEAAIAATVRLNRVHAELFEQNYLLPLLAYPALGAAWYVDPVDLLALDELRSDPAMDRPRLTEAVLRRLERSGQRLLMNDQAINDPVVLRGRVSNTIEDLFRDRLPAMCRLGAGVLAGPAVIRESD